LWQLSFSFFKPMTQILTAFFKPSPPEISMWRQFCQKVD
jgi:hypothetical protein